MKKSFLIMAALVFAGVATFTACNSPSQKVENAEENVEQAKEDLAKAKQEYVAELASFKKQHATQFLSNEQKIAELKTQVAKEQEANRAAYLKRISELEQRNLVMKNRLAEYNYDSQENWKSFKADFSRDMDDLGRALTNFFDNK
jgi:phosphoenolpyruvate-protein kinase (PTS system EI component)